MRENEKYWIDDYGNCWSKSDYTKDEVITNNARVQIYIMYDKNGVELYTEVCRSCAVKHQKKGRKIALDEYLCGETPCIDEVCCMDLEDCENPTDEELEGNSIFCQCCGESYITMQEIIEGSND